MNVEILCGSSELIPPKELKAHPKNAHKHPDEQITRLAKLIEYHGFRHPILVSKHSGFIVAGHARLEAAKKLNMGLVPVEYQDFESDEAEFSFLVSDNAISEFSELDLASINIQIQELGPEFDLDLLGLQSFTLDPPMIEHETKQKELKYFECPSCHEICEKQQLIPVSAPHG